MPAVRRQPRIDLAQWLGSDPVDAALCVDAGFDQPGIAQDLEVLRDGGLAQRQGFDEVAHRALALDQDVENAATTLLGQHLEGNGPQVPNILSRAYNCQGILGG